jgi:hypothetical protein
MELITGPKFEARAKWGKPPAMDVRAIEHLPYRCACGETHTLAEAERLKDRTRRQLLLACPADTAVRTCVQVEGLLRTKLVPLYGTLGDLSEAEYMFSGTHIPVVMLDYVLHKGGTVDDFLDAFPPVRRKQVEEILRAREAGDPVPQDPFAGRDIARDT